MNHRSSHQFTLAKSICSLSPIHSSRNVSSVDDLIVELILQILKIMVIIIMIVVVHGELQYNIF
jgi:hypothetical protein